MICQEIIFAKVKYLGIKLFYLLKLTVHRKALKNKNPYILSVKTFPATRFIFDWETIPLSASVNL